VVGFVLAALALCLPVVVRPVAAQQATIFYVYDDLNRLIAVVDQQGNAATYTYDAVGNLLGIERFDTTGQGPVAISLFSPGSGKIGTVVQIFGKGFSVVPGQNSVAFNGTAATVTAAAPNRLVAAVPSGATTGPIAVTTPLGAATSSRTFRVLGVIVVTPATGSLGPNATRQFEASEGGAPTTNIRWAVNGTTGGDAIVGSISIEGLYTSPSVIPTPPTVTITATHRDDTTLSGSATITLIPPAPVFLAARAVTVGFPEPPLAVDRSVTASVSVTVTADPGTSSIPGLPVSVQIAATETPTVIGGRPVSIDFAPPGDTFAATAQVTVSVEPVITSVTPASSSAGSTLTVTLAGAGLEGATALALLRNNAVDSTITVSNLIVNANGTQATADLVIAAGAAAGGRVLRITTPAGSSTAAGTGTNIFTVP
jgi:YD repeat-containing protein